MTSQKDQIQALIAEIDSVLQKTHSRLPWVMSGELAQQRQVLERVRNYLVVLQQQLPVDGLRPTEAASPIGYPPEFYPFGASVSRSPVVDTQQMMQTILQEMSYLRASVMQPMQVDLESLRQRRELLTKEISHLEAERRNQTVASAPNQQQFTDELIQVLMSRLQESLSQQMGQTLGNLQAQALSGGANPSSLGEPLPGALANPQYEQLQILRSRSDQMLVNLDSTLNIVFESLQRNIQAYQTSLTHGLERMYSLGQQSEVAFKALINELTQQLNQEASSYLHSLAQGRAAINPEAANPARIESFKPVPETLSESVIAKPSISLSPSPNFPYPGMEVLATDLSTADLIGATAEDKSLPLMPELDAALESWLRSADTSNFDVTELTSNSLDLGIPLNNSASAQLEVDFSHLSDAAIAGSNAPASDVSASDLTLPSKDTAELDEALKLLEELSSELTNPLTGTMLQDTDVQIDQILSLVKVPSSENSVSAVEDTSVEQDEFYQSLFGDSALAQADQAEPEENEFVTQSAIAPFSDRANDFFPEATNLEPAELDDIDHLATLADLTFESTDELELPELFFEAAAAETTSITELPASLFDDDSVATPSTEPYPLTAETESLLADLEPFSLEPDGTGSLSDLFQDFPLESAQSTPVDPPETAFDWASLQDTAPTANSPQSMQSDALTIGLPDSEFALEGREDQFTRAALDENLLPDAFHEVANLSLNLDDFTLSSLSEDLSNLEDSTTWQPDLGTSDIPLNDMPLLDEFSLLLEDTQETAQHHEQFSSDRADLTVEEFGTLFDDAPNVSPPVLPPSVISSSLPTFSPQEAQSPTEQTSTVTAQFLPSLQDADDSSLPFTLEGMDDLFGDASSIESVPPPPVPQYNLADSSLSSLGMQDFFGASSSPLPNGTEVSLPFTLEGMDDLFGDAPSVQVTASPAPRPPAKEILPFKPDYGQQSTEEKPPLKLEELGDFLIETPSMPPSSSGIGSQENTSNLLATTSSPENPPLNPPINLQLDEAFESLLGKSTSLQPSAVNEQAKEKKKKP
ncbi:hypothetical protein JOY44_08325 [Phormidium sp. CLA17]|uniref:hypothetical protein n=1 Tax=Leptolyngbya sp. Cla-17 TaxID=2803751 RepID=UPI0014925C4A|nr:hypothetical protein [Leptolyngbya sp. Cla-17]MBM0741620.1 hypothetical protein [Leptolyngbya sp. Cla-17]